MKKIFLTFLSLLFLASCMQQLEEEPNVNNFTGEELFGSIFFLEGRAVNRISHLKSMRDEIDLSTANNLKDAVSTVKNDIISIISENNANFF